MTADDTILARLCRHRGAKLGAALVALVLALAIFGPIVAPSPPNESDFAHGIDPRGLPIGPSSFHWLGTDGLFRDELARLAHGARSSLGIATTATIISTTIGALVGVTAGWNEGRKLAFVDAALMRIVDVLLAFPYLLLVMAIGAALDAANATTVLVVLGMTSWLGTARIVRAKTMQIRELGFVEAARALGQTTPRILLSHVLPNVSGTLVVVSTVSMSSMILAESVLSYLAVGSAPPTATWGRMLYEGQHTLTLQPRLAILPGLAILTSALGFTLLGEGLRDVLGAREIR